MSNILTLFADGIINYLFLASIVAIVVTSLLRVIIKVTRIRAPIYHHMIWQYALIGIVVFPALWLYGPILTFEILPTKDQSAQTILPETDIIYDAPITQTLLREIHSPNPTSAEATAIDHAIPPRSFPIKAMLAGLWFYGTILMLLRLYVGWYRLRRICLIGEPVPGKIRLENWYGGRLGILLTSQVDGPVCFGIWQPVILLPRGMYENSLLEDLQMVLNHELAHIERRDYLVNFFQRIIESIFFFHPFVWYASFQLSQQREQICDNYVIQKGAHIMNYSKFLSRIAEQKFEKMRFQAVALFEGRLLQRVRSLLDPKRDHQIHASRWVTLAGAVALIVCLIFGAVRLEAKPNVVKGSVVSQDEMILGTPESRPKGNCSISGKVISEKTGKSVKHAKVILSMEGHSSIMINTASDGTFIFKDIPTGPFCLSMTNTLGFHDVFYNPENRPGSRPQFTLADAERRANVVLRAIPACSITGRILDENGEPLRGQRLRVHAYEELAEPKGELRYNQAINRRMAPDDGSYSLSGLDGHPVYVMVIDSSSEFKDEYYPPCYYPGTVDRNKARKVTFDEKMSMEDIDIRLQKKGEFILEGVVTDQRTGNPVPKTLVTVHHRDMLFDYITTYTNEQGRYRIESIGTGEFFVHVDAKLWGFVRTMKPVEIEASIKTTVLDFKLRPGVTISGKLVDEDGNPIEIDRSAWGSAYRRYDPNSTKTIYTWIGVRNRYSTAGLTSVYFHASEGDYEDERMIFPTPSSFIIEGMIPGRTILFFNPRIRSQAVKEILYNGENISKAGIETRPGQEIKDVTIVIKTVP
ncbi:MAG: M56 family metallopeptidase [Phycisphaerae bacterium]